MVSSRLMVTTVAWCVDDGEPRPTRIQGDNGWDVAVLVSLLDSFFHCLSC